MRRIALLVPLFAALVLAGSAPAAGATKAKQEHARPPTLLWLAFPLKQRPYAASARTVRRDAAASSATGSGGFHRPMLYLLVAFAVSAGLAVTLLTLLWAQLATSGGRRRTIGKPWRGNGRVDAPLAAHLRQAWARGRRARLQPPARARPPELVAATASTASAARARGSHPAARAEPARIMQALRRKPVQEHASEHAAELGQEREDEERHDDMLGALVAAERAAIISVGKEQELKLEARERALAEKEEELQARAAELEAEREALNKRALKLDREREQTELALAAERRRLSAQAQEAIELERARLASIGKKLEQRDRALAVNEKTLAAERAKLDAEQADRRAAIAAERAKLEAPRADVEQKRAALEKRELQLARDRKKLEQRDRELAAKEKAAQARLAAIEAERDRELAAARKAFAAERAKLETEHADRLGAIAAEKAGLEAAQSALEQQRAELVETSRPKRTSRTKREPKATARRSRAQPARTTGQAAPARPQAGAPPRQERVRSAAEACQIALWRGYVKWHLYTSQVGAYRLPSAVASGAFMRLRDEKSPTAAAEQALAGLLEELTRTGWVIVEKGPRWYDYRLERG